MLFSPFMFLFVSVEKSLPFSEKFFPVLVYTQSTSLTFLLVYFKLLPVVMLEHPLAVTKEVIQ